METVKSIILLFAALVLAIFAKRYADMKERDLKNRLKEVEDEKKNIVLANDSTDLDDLVERENARLRTILGQSDDS